MPDARTDTVTSPWLVCRRRNPDAAIRLYCFPHSGGSVGEFAGWARELPDVEVWGIALPGRGTRMDEPPHTDLGSLVAELAAETGFHPPFAFFGHSLGALLAYELARELRTEGRAQPERVFLSAYHAPHLPRDLPPIHHLGDQEMFAAGQGTYTTLPAELDEDPELFASMMATLRADFTIAETYRHTPGDPLDIPFHVLAGTEDRLTTEQMRAWQEHSRHPLELRWFPGGHFYLREQRSALLSLIHTRCLTTPERDTAKGSP